MIVTPYGHVLYTKMLQIAGRFISAILRIRFRYIAHSFPLYCATEGGGGGVRKTYSARSRIDGRRLTSRSNGMPSKKIMESLCTFVFVETVLRRGRMFQGSDEV